MTILTFFEENTSKSLDRTAFEFLDISGTKNSLSYEELYVKSRALASYFQQYTKPGDRVLLSYSPGLDFIIAFWGCLHAGLTAVPAYPLRNNHHAKRFRSMIEDCKPRLICGTRESLKFMQQQEEFLTYQYIFTDELNNAANISYSPPIITPDTLAFLQYTSGSTGAPKGVMITHENLLANMRAIHHFYQLTSNDLWVTWIPLQHDMGLLGCLLYPLYTNRTHVFMAPATFITNPLMWLKTISDYQATGSVSSNFGYELCVDKLRDEEIELLDLSCWRIAANGSEPIRHQTLEAFYNKFKKYGFNKNAFLPCYGMAETTLLISGKPHQNSYVTDEFEKSVIVSSGHVYKEYQLKIVNPNTLIECPEGEVGEIWVSGPSVSQGYWHKKQATKETFHAHLENDERNYLRTGDLGIFKKQELYIVGRLKDLIILQGRNIYPQDVEQAVAYCHDAIRKGCVAAFSVEIKQQEQLVVVAEIERTYRKIDFAPVFQAIRKAVIDDVGVIPYSIQLLAPAQTQKTTSGKIQRKATQQAYLKGELVTLATEELLPEAFTELPSKSELKEVIRGLLQKVLALDEIDPNARFTELGGTSLQAVIFQEQLQGYLGSQLEIHASILFDYPTLAKLSDYLYGCLNKEERKNECYAREIVFAEHPIAIVGMACHFPGKASNPDAFWRLLFSGQDGICEVPKERWDWHKYAEEIANHQGGYLEQIEWFAPEFFNISPREALSMDPQQRLLLEATWQAFEQAGISLSELSGSDTGVFVGATTHEYSDLLIKEAQKDRYVAIGNSISALAGRLSYTFGFQGPCLSIDTACSSSLVALSEACEHLHLGETSLAIVAGVNALLTPDGFIQLSQANMLSKKGYCQVFSDEADGYVRGEGCGVVLLKRLSDAERDNNRILGVIKSAVVNQDGASSGFTVPNGASQEKLIRQALIDAKLSPKDIDYLEAHGTGTVIGDPMETHALAQVFAQSHESHNPLIIGSVKANVGHLEAAAGMAGLIKVLLSLEHETIPRQIHVNNINPKINLHNIPAQIPLSHISWPYKKEHIRRAGISSFGFTGTNAHIIVEEAPIQQKREAVALPKEYLFVLSAKSHKSLDDLIQAYIKYLAETKDSIADICYTAATGRSHFEFRVAVSASSKKELIKQLKQAMPVEAILTDEVIKSDELNELKHAYCSGFTINWAAYYAPYFKALRKVTLPTYAFDRRRYWIETSNTKTLEQLPDDCFYELLWQEQELSQRATFTGVVWVIDNGVSWKHPALGEHIKVLPKKISSIMRMKTFPNDLLGIIYYAPVDNKLEVMSYQKHYGHDFLALAQLLAKKQQQLNYFQLGLVLITQKAQRVLLDEAPTCIEAAPLGGMIKALQWEAPYLKARWIDVDANDSLAQGIWACEHSLLSLRAGQWYSPTIQQAILSSSKENLYTQGCHWITGGTGGLGLALSEYLIKQGVTQLLLTSRRGETNEVKQALSSLRALGVTIEVLSLNMADKKAVSSLIKERGFSLSAIYHLAGIEQSGPFTDLTVAQYDELLAAKARGASLLDELTQSLPLHHFVLFSSISSFMGNYHQIAYVAANQYLDALAQKRQAQNLPVTCINWGPWADVGMATRMQLKLDESLLLPVSTGFEAMFRLIGLKKNSIAVSKPEAIAQRMAFLSEPKPQWLGALLRLEKETQQSRMRSQLAIDLLAMEPKSRLHRLEELIGQNIKAVLRVEELPAFNKGFFELGMDSLMSVEVGQKLQEQLGVTLKPTVAFDYPTIEQFAVHLDEVLSEQKQVIDYIPHRLAADAPVAIIGMACRFPGGANSLEQFWDNLYQGVDAIGEVPKQRFDIDAYYDADQQNTQKMHTREFGFIDGIDAFDAGFFGISPREALLMDPQQRILLETTWHALEDAGIDPATLKGKRVGVFVGIQNSEYASYLIAQASENFGAYQATGNSLSVAAGRIAYVLGTQGPTMSIDTACSSSLVALHEAMNALRAAECDLAVVAGVNSIIDPNLLVSLSNAQMLSPDGRCKTFDAQANGYGRAEGCGVIILQGKSQAIEHGARIWASIRASHVNQDGASSGLTVPNQVAQVRLLQECLLQAGLSPDDIDYIECHGTGTSLGDPIEVGAIADVHAGRKEPLIVGTVKTNIGHLETASGIAGLIKTVLAINHQYIPKHLHFHELNPYINLENIPAQIPVEGLPWVQRDNQPRRAGVSSFGFSGTNAHVILEEVLISQEKDLNIELPEKHLFVLSANSKTSLNKLITAYSKYLKNKNESIADICYTAAIGRMHFKYRIAWIVSSIDELQQKLQEKRNIQKSKLSNEIIQSDNLLVLHEAYLEGKQIDWSQYYAPYIKTLHIVSLPTYEFEHQSYWLNSPSPKKLIMSEQESISVDNKNSLILKYKDINFEWLPNLLSQEEQASVSYERYIYFMKNAYRFSCVADFKHLDDEFIYVSANPEKLMPVNELHHFIDMGDFDLIKAHSAHSVELSMVIYDCFYLINEQSNELKLFFDILIRLIQFLIQSKIKTHFIILFDAENELISPDVFYGFFSSIHQENDLINATLVTLSQQNRYVHKIIQYELFNKNFGIVDVKYDNKKRFIKVHEVIERESEEHVITSIQHSILSPHKTYLITGGLGGIGFNLAMLLAKKYKSNLILIGRSEHNERINEKLLKLTELGAQVHYISFNLDNIQYLSEQLDDLREKWGSIDGVFHLAGITEDSFIENKSLESFNRVYAAKAVTVEVIDALTSDDKLNFFVLFSSISQVFGNVGQADYALANGFLSSFERVRNRWLKQGKRFGRTLCINWPYWDVNGMSINKEILSSLNRIYGILELDFDLGAEILEKLLTYEHTNTTILIGTEKTKQFVDLVNIKSLPTTTTHAVDSIYLDKLQDELSLFLTFIFSTELKVSMNEIEKNESLYEYGLDSLMMVNVLNKFERILWPIRKGIFLSSTTIEEISSKFIKNYRDIIHIKLSTYENKLTPKNLIDIIKQFSLADLGGFSKEVTHQIDLTPIKKSWIEMLEKQTKRSKAAHELHALSNELSHIKVFQDAHQSLWIYMNKFPGNLFDLNFLEQFEHLNRVLSENNFFNAKLCYFASTQEVYSLGGDRAVFLDIAKNNDREQIQKYMDKVINLYTLCDKPILTVSVVDGSAQGGGFEMLLTHDFQVVAPGVSLSLPEIKSGIFPGMGGLSYLSANFGNQIVKKLAMLGDLIVSEDAYELGIISHLANNPFETAYNLYNTIPDVDTAIEIKVILSQDKIDLLKKDILRWGEYILSGKIKSKFNVIEDNLKFMMIRKNDPGNRS